MTSREQQSGELVGAAKTPRRDPLRARAEKTLRKTRLDVGSISPAGVQRLFHELQVHQIELKMQNEELQAAARDLEDSRMEYQSLYELAPVGYLELNADAVIERSNPAASALLSINRPGLVGKAFAAFVDSQDLRTLNGHLRAVRKTGAATCEVHLGALDRGGPYAKLETSGGPARGSGYRMVLTDITERRRAEQALQKLNQELEERVAARTAELAQRNQELEREILNRIQGEQERRRLEARLREAERLEGLGLLAGGIAHDFNNLLVGVISNADVMLENEQTADQTRQGLQLIRSAGLSAADLTRQMLIYAGQGRVRLAAVDLESTVAHALELVRSRVPRGIEVQARFDPGLPAINGDGGQVQQVVTNLVTNSIEAIGDSAGQIVLYARLEELDAMRLSLYTHRNEIEPGAFVVLRVDDTGTGMDTGRLARVFDPFYTTKFSGRGLGLASVLGIVRGHHAGLCVNSQPGVGTSFEIAWPIARKPAVSQSPQRPAVRTTWRASGRALVIDDNDGVRSAVACHLGQMGFDVTEAANGSKGLDLFRSAAPGFVLAVVDRTMPGLSGEETISALHELQPKLPVVLMSGYPGKKLVLPNEHVTFLQKPMTTEQLRQVVHRLLEPRS